MKNINILIVHYNTPKLTECLIRSINKQITSCTVANIYIFDNSDTNPFTYRQDNIRYIDNTEKQIIDFEKWGENYPNKMEPFYSSKHSYTIQTFIEMNGEPFILMDSDILLKRDISDLWDENMAFIGEGLGKRIIPFICFINPKILKEHDIKYFDDRFTYDLNKDNSGTKKYDTGYTLWANKNLVPHKLIKYNSYIVHYRAGSYAKEYFVKNHSSQLPAEKWLNVNKRYWESGPAKKNVLIVNYNTQKLTDACIKSVNKHTPGCRIYVFDNSDKEPFVNTFKNVTVMDNTKGKIIDFKKFLAKYPDRMKSNGRVNNWGSAKHCVTVEKCIEMIREPFVLLDSDVLVKKDISGLWNSSYIYVSEVVFHPTFKVNRVSPLICYINAKMCLENHVHYFNENYMHGLRKTEKGDSYDTGAWFYVGARNHPHKQIVSADYVVHYKAGSWSGVYKDYLIRKEGNDNGYKEVDEWLEENKQYWGDGISKSKIIPVIENEKRVTAPTPSNTVSRVTGLKKHPVVLQRRVLTRNKE